jgi:imidazolonepropionase-like amidohydrolase
MLRSISALALLAAHVALAVESSAAGPADSILLNGRILVFSRPERHERASPPRFEQAIAIRDGRIAFIGTSDEARQRAGPATRVTDLQGRMVMPGIVDVHAHHDHGSLGMTPAHNFESSVYLAYGVVDPGLLMLLLVAVLFTTTVTAATVSRLAVVGSAVATVLLLGAGFPRLIDVDSAALRARPLALSTAQIRYAAAYDREGLARQLSLTDETTGRDER